MLIDVSSVIKESGSHLDVDFTESIDAFEFMGENYSFYAPARIKGTVSNNGKGLEFKAIFTGEMDTSCARCTDDIRVAIEFEINEFFIRDEDHNDQDGDVYIYSGYQIDVTDAIIDCLVMNIDSRYLCTPDCKGLCPTCGTNLNFETCSCADDSIDPRWEKLKALMDDNTH